jgi:hypothetical protein
VTLCRLRELWEMLLEDITLSHTSLPHYIHDLWKGSKQENK